MPNMRPDKNPMPHQDPQARACNFSEVALGYTREQAMDEAQRCLSCKHMPCVAGCPVQIRIPEFIAKVAGGDFEGAYQIIAQDSALPAVCGRVCPQESQCEAKCVRGIKNEPVGIGRLERFVADWHNANATEKAVPPAPNGHKVAVIGWGPAGLTCAGDLAKKGYEVTVFEALHLAGGVLVYGIPEFRLPKSIVQKEVDTLKELGVKVETNMVIGRAITIDELKEEFGFEAVFIGSGAGLPKFMNIPGENLKGVYSANEFLTRINLMKAYQDGADTPIQHSTTVAVVGGGNSAAADALLLSRVCAKGYLIHRRDSLRAERAYHAPLMAADNVEFCWNSVVAELIHGEGFQGLRLRDVNTGAERTVDCAGVFVSIGRKPASGLAEGQLALDRSGYITADESTRTEIPGVYAVGDVRTKALRQIVTAAADGAVAVHYAEEYLAGGG